MKAYGFTSDKGGAWWRRPDPDNEPVKSARARERSATQRLVEEHLDGDLDLGDQRELDRRLLGCGCDDCCRESGLLP